MSTLVVDDAGTLIGADELTKEIRRELTAAREDRKRFEATWHSNLAYAAGKFWLKWHRDQRRLIFPPELYGKELYTADVITEYRSAALSELASDNSRPEILLRREDPVAEDFQEQLARAIEWGWDHEWRADDVLSEMQRLVVDMGTAAIRVRFDPTVGPVLADDVPHVDGRPVLDPEQARELLANGPTDGVQMRSIQQGRITWEPLSPFNLLVPPGVPHERDFPWECVVRPVPLRTVKREYGDLAADLKEDTDIGSILGLDTQAELGDTEGLSSFSDGKTGRLKGHVWLYTYYERPCPDYPHGRTIVFGGSKMKPLKIEQRLPCERGDGSPHSGITYFHWWRVTGRFWSRSLVEAMKDVQRSVNKRRTQINEIIDRGLPAVFVQKDSPAKERKGHAVELLEIGPEERQPTIFPGISPGEWMYHDIQEMREDLDHATGIKAPRLGENPTNVTTYAQLALLNENDQQKRQTIMRDHALAKGELLEATVYEIRTYWGQDRTMALADEDGRAQAHVFDATRIPPFFLVRIAKGSAKPRSPAAEIKKIEDIWNAALASGAVVQNPHAWVTWLKESFEAGQVIDLPTGGADDHEEKAELENMRMLEGELPTVQYYDPAEVHIPIHRQAQIDAELVGDLELWSRIELHIQQHVLTAQATAQAMATMAAPQAPAEAPEPTAGGVPQ